MCSWLLGRGWPKPCFLLHHFNHQVLFHLFLTLKFLVTVLVSFCCILKYAKAWWLKTVAVCLVHASKGQQFVLSSAGWYFCLSHQGSLLSLRAAGGQFMRALPGMAGVFGPLFIQPTFLQEISLGLFTR